MASDKPGSAVPDSPAPARVTDAPASVSDAGGRPWWPRRHARLSLLLLTLIALGWLLGLQWFTLQLAAAPPDAPVPADAIVVLTGGSNRLDTGFDLLKKRLGKQLFISGVAHGVEVKALMKRWEMADHGGLDCCVELGFEADDTLGNARETTAWLRKKDYHSFYLVTANYHMTRALLIFRTFSPAFEVIPWPVDPDELRGKDWWAEPATRSLILREYSKYLVTLFWSSFSKG